MEAIARRLEVRGGAGRMSMPRHILNLRHLNPQTHWRSTRTCHIQRLGVLSNMEKLGLRIDLAASALEMISDIYRCASEG